MFQISKKWTGAGELLQHRSVEHGLLFFLIATSLFFVWSVPAFVSMDGPAHLYNASLLSNYGSGSFLREYYLLNHLFFPNCLTHWILVLLLRLAPALACEKILVSIIVIAVPLTFRLAVRAVSGQRSISFLLIFMLVFSNLLHSGFYNFCFAFIFFNLQIWLLFKWMNADKNSFGLAAGFIINSLCLLFTHGFVFAACVLLLIVLLSLHKGPFTFFWKSLLSLVLMLIPALIIFGYFFFAVRIPDYNYDLHSYEKWEDLVNFSSAIVFDKKNELNYSVPFFILLLVVTAIILSNRMVEKKGRWSIDIFLIAFIALVYLIFHSKDGLLGGMFIPRLFYFGFYAWIFWISCHKISGWLSAAALVVLLYSFLNLANERHKVMQAIGPEIKAVLEARELIKDSSTVYVVNLSNSWFRGHFSNYLGVNKQIVVSDNYEAVLDWFPLKWKKDEPLFSLNTDKNDRKKMPDYVFIYANPRLDQKPDSAITAFLENQTIQLYEAPGRSCTLFKTKK